MFKRKGGVYQVDIFYWLYGLFSQSNNDDDDDDDDDDACAC